MRNTEEPMYDERGDEVHPAFAVVTTSRSQGTDRTLFQSDLRHHEMIRLTISRATRKRDLNRDWVHPSEELIEIEMSLARWSDTRISSSPVRRTPRQGSVSGLKAIAALYQANDAKELSS